MGKWPRQELQQEEKFAAACVAYQLLFIMKRTLFLGELGLALRNIYKFQCRSKAAPLKNELSGNDDDKHNLC